MVWKPSGDVCRKPRHYLIQQLGSVGLETSRLSACNRATLRATCAVAASQQLLYPGKLKFRGEIASKEADAASSDLEAIRRRVTADVKTAFFEYWFYDKAIQTTLKDKDLLTKLSRRLPKPVIGSAKAFSRMFSDHKSRFHYCCNDSRCCNSKEILRRHG